MVSKKLSNKVGYLSIMIQNLGYISSKFHVSIDIFGYFIKILLIFLLNKFNPNYFIFIFDFIYYHYLFHSIKYI